MWNWRTGSWRQGSGVYGVSKRAVVAVLFLLGIGFVFESKVCSAKTFYLDNRTGVLNGSTNYDPASRTVGSGGSLVYTSPWDAGQALVSGDTLYIRQGTYWAVAPGGGTGNNWTLGSLTVSDYVTGATIAGYGSEVVWLSCGSSLATVVGSPNNALCLNGTNNTVKNINIWGCTVIGGTGNTLENCNASGGWDHQSPIGSDAWYDIIRIRGTNNTVRNCLIHDNYNHGTATANENKAIIMHDQDENSIFENNKFYNAVAGFAYVKYGRQGGTLQTTYRYNWFNGGASAPFTGNGIATGQTIRVYQNIIMNSAGVAWFNPETTTGHKFEVFNNVFYNVNSSVFAWNIPDGHVYYNNIVYSNSGTSWAVNYNEVASPTSYFNYNNYYSTGSGSLRWSKNFSTYTSLSSWRSQGFDPNSVDTNPNFVNASGTFSVPSDFKRASYPANGRGGGYGAVMGAYLTGNETIGPGAGLAPPPPAGKTPNPPTALNIN